MVDQSYEDFEKSEYTLGVFIDLSKTFDAVDHPILLKKLELYGVPDKNHACIKSYLSNGSQNIEIENRRTWFCIMKCRVPHCSISGPLLFSLYVNILKNASSVLDPFIFTDDTNLFYTHSNIQKLFSVMNEELASINQWFTSNKFSLNAKKQNIPFSINPVKEKTSLLCYQSWLWVIILLRGKNLLNFTEYY